MRYRTAAAASLAVVISLSSCGLLPGAGEPEGEDADAEESAAGYGDFPYEKEGRIFIEGDDDVRVRLSITALESGPEYTMLEYGITFLDPFDSGSGLSSPSRLVDPIDGLAYEQLRDPADPDGRAFGTYFVEEQGVGVVPTTEGVTRMTRAFFPPFPDYVTNMTYTGQGMGAMTGIPVEHVDQISPAPEPDAEEYFDPQTFEPHEDIAEGTEVWFPVREPEGDFWDAPRSMESTVDDGEIAVTRAGPEETFSLNADVGFEFGEAELNSEVEESLSQLGEYMADNLDPEGYIQVTGHTDGVGDDASNRTLSEQRAESVRDVLESQMGDTFEIRTEGAGSSEPLVEEGGSDDEEARARNRRVDIGHELPLDQVIEQEMDRSEGLVERAGDPAAFSADDGESHVTLADGDVELNVYPFVRDGAYVIAVVGFSNTGSQPVAPDLGGEAARLPGQPDQFNEGTLGGFQTVDGQGTTRSVVQINHPDEGYASFAEEVQELSPGDEYLTIAWFLAPEEDVTSLTLDAGAFGEAADVPIR